MMILHLQKGGFLTGNFSMDWSGRAKCRVSPKRQMNQQQIPRLKATFLSQLASIDQATSTIPMGLDFIFACFPTPHVLKKISILKKHQSC